MRVLHPIFRPDLDGGNDASRFIDLRRLGQRSVQFYAPVLVRFSPFVVLGLPAAGFSVSFRPSASVELYRLGYVSIVDLVK